MKIAIELDDFSPRNSNFGLLEELREHFPGFKVTLFTSPWEIRWGEQTPITLEDYAPWVKAVKEASDWIEIAVHGLTHHPSEFAEISRDEAKKRVIIAEKMFMNREIPFVKIFKAPYWLLSPEAKSALEQDLGYKVVEDGYYQWNLADTLPQTTSEGIIIAHGHVQNTQGNGLEECFPKLMQLPSDTKFCFLSEALGVKR